MRRALGAWLCRHGLHRWISVGMSGAFWIYRCERCGVEREELW
jgi:hypothetical protein